MIYAGATILGRITIGARLDHRRQCLADAERSARQPVTQASARRTCQDPASTERS